jgi:hypothetical protein
VSYLSQHAILCPTNKVVDAVYGVLFSMVPGNATVFSSYDVICKTMDHMPDADQLYPHELTSVLAFSFLYYLVSIQITHTLHFISSKHI